MYIYVLKCLLLQSLSITEKLTIIKSFIQVLLCFESPCSFTQTFHELLRKFRENRERFTRIFTILYGISLIA